MDDILSDFLTETSDSLERVETALLRLETSPQNRAIADDILRHLHTIKGACGFLDLARLSALAEAGESLVSRALDSAPRTACDLMLRCIDRMCGVVAGIEAKGEEPAGDDRALLDEIYALAHGLGAPTRTAPGDTASRPAPGAMRVDQARLAAIAIAADHLRAVSADAPIPPGVSEAIRAVLAATDLLRRRPIGEAWRPLPRLTREAAAAHGKHAEIVFEGEDVALEAEILEQLRAPLIHLVRNAVAHGVEPPEERLALGKREIGLVRVSARMEAGGVAIEINDDGAGLSPIFLRRRGIERGLIGASDAARMSDEDTLSLIFAPGFSTAHRLDALAGRGVGLDAARTTIQHLGGTLEVDPNPGIGATFRIRIPTVAPAAEKPAAPDKPIMLIDPSEPAHDRIAAHFTAAGYAVDTAPSVAPETAAPPEPLEKSA